MPSSGLSQESLDPALGPAVGGLEDLDRLGLGEEGQGDATGVIAPVSVSDLGVNAEGLAVQYRTIRKEIIELKTHFDAFKSGIEESLEEIKALLTPDQEGFAPALMLSKHGDRSDPAGTQIAEQISRIKTSLKG